jgi:hypothetical protein
MHTIRSSSQRFLYFCVGLGCAAALVGGRSSELNAQEVQFRSRAGLYLPTKISFQDGAIHLHQKVGVRVGARMTLTFTERFAVITGVSYIPGYAEFSGVGKEISLGTGSHRLSASSGARYWLLKAERAFSCEVHTGVGAVFGGRSDNGDLFANSTVTGVVGMTLGYQIGRIVRLQMRIQERLYRITFGQQSPSTRPPLRVTFGMAFPFLESEKL